MFATRKDMRTYMYNRGVQERKLEEWERKEEKNSTAVFDELTKTHIFVYPADIENYGKEKAMELARERQKKQKLAMELARERQKKEKLAEFSQLL